MSAPQGNTLTPMNGGSHGKSLGKHLLCRMPSLSLEQNPYLFIFLHWSLHPILAQFQACNKVTYLTKADFSATISQIPKHLTGLIQSSLSSVPKQAPFSAQLSLLKWNADIQILEKAYIEVNAKHPESHCRGGYGRFSPVGL